VANHDFQDVNQFHPFFIEPPMFKRLFPKWCETSLFGVNSKSAVCSPGFQTFKVKPHHFPERRGDLSSGVWDMSAADRWHASCRPNDSPA
jgi:hypothetical protein